MSDTGAKLSSKEQTLLLGDELVYAARVTRVMHRSVKLDNCLVVLTSQRLIASKQKVFGTPKHDVSVFWDSVSRCNGEQWAVDPTQIVLTFETDHGPLAVIDNSRTIYEIETRGRSIYSR